MILGAGFLWFTWLSDKITHDNVHIVHGLIILAFLTVCSLIYKASLKPIEQEIVPDGNVSIKNIFQTAIESLLNLMRTIIPHHTEDYFPILGAVFIYIFCSNLMGVVPGLLPPTENISSNLAIAVTIFLYYNIMGMRRQGFGNYMGHFFGPSLGKSVGMLILRFGFLGPLMFVIELISHSVRPVSLSIRLFGNINGDHIVLSTFQDLVPVGVPVIFLAFGIFVSFIQAFVFTLLSTIYIGLAVEVHEHHH